MSKLDIAIAGEINLDLILYGLPEQMPTERELLASGFTITLGSSSAILAHNLAALGSRVGFVAKVGDDSFGALAMERLREGGVDLARVAHGATSGVTLILPHGSRRHILTYPGTIAELRLEDLDLDYLASARHFHMSSLFLQRDLLPNAHEAMRISRAEDVETALSRLAQKVETVVVKMGGSGAIAIRDGHRFSAPAVPVTVIDPIGAGDSFDAVFLHQFLRGADLATCLAYGNLCGAFSATDCGGTEAFRDTARMQEFLR